MVPLPRENSPEPPPRAEDTSRAKEERAELKEEEEDKGLVDRARDYLLGKGRESDYLPGENRER